MAIDLGDIITFLGDTTQLDQAYARVGKLLLVLTLLTGSLAAETLTITNVASTPQANGAKITWTTSLAAASDEYCALNITGGVWSRCGTTHNSNQVTSHSATFTGLLSGTAYKYHIFAHTSTQSIESANFVFTTLTSKTLSSIAVTPASASVSVGGTRQFAATGTYSG